MKNTVKLSTLLFAAIAFIAFSCNQTKNSEESSQETSEESTIDHKDAGQMNNDQMNDEDHAASTGDFSSIDDQQAATVLDAYLELKNALVKSSAEAAQEAAEQIKSTLTNHAESQELEGMLEDANHILDTDEIEHMREHFDLMSQNVYAMVKLKNTGKTVYKEFCPMAFDNKGAFWLSSEKEIKNPYFGDKMLTCGKVQETIASK